MIAVLDDDPTGSQTVHGVPIVLALDDDALQLDADTTFFLTNTRSLPEAEAAELTGRVARRLLEQDPDLQIISRSDSTLRGHVVAEVEAIDRARHAVLGRGYDAVLLVPAFFEAGRFTRDDIHWAGDVPVGETEFARDATFGYRSSNLLEFVREKCGDVPVTSISREHLGALETAGGWIVVNAESYDDLDAVVRGIEATGRTFLYRTGPSFVRALAGVQPIDPLTADDIWPDGKPPGHGLVVVGSHVGLTTRQIEATSGLHEIELDVNALDPEAVGREAAQALREHDVLVYTSRELVRGDDPLATARRVSTAVTEVVRTRARRPPRMGAGQGRDHLARRRRPRARHPPRRGPRAAAGRHGVGLPADRGRRARRRALPYVVFAGNVGDEDTLAEIVQRFRA